MGHITGHDQFILTETSLTAQASDEVMIIQALDNGHFTIGYLEVVFQQMNQMKLSYFYLYHCNSDNV